ncbi:YihY/virulence factor BrkB family protein [uncultured Erythrobacter sp.]|uniref:YihY/virulence factor BrkB family protein n=1 Tax=uncultured Erythrobacter sp. TaxID=263913 RepID=UPI0026048E2B|nr:YihY/virulence factor BrkB family protein [uncultured Erythrobacter sp.]
MGAPSDYRPQDPREIRSLSPEARRRHSFLAQHLKKPEPEVLSWQQKFARALGPGTRFFEVVRRTAVGSYNDGFIHAGNLAYLSMLAIFPFFILGAALFELIGGREQSAALIETVLVATPPTVSEVIRPVAENSAEARSGWLLWLGAGIGLWTVSSLIETIRDILRRAYGTTARHAFWKYRLLSAGLILGAMILLMASLFAQVAIGTAQQVIDARLPQLAEAIGTLRLSRIVPALGLFGSLYMLFYTLTPEEYRKRRYPKWPGAVFTALWWLGVSSVMPAVLRSFFTYNLTYGSLAGIMIALFFFWLVGLGLVIGAELNAALAEPDANTSEDTERENLA